MSQPEAFVPDLAPEVLEDMMSRIRATRWPAVIGEDSWKYGVPQRWLKDMAAYWVEEWDWATQRNKMAQWDHFKLVVDDVTLHYLHAPASRPGAMPLVLLHGWPWTFWDFKDVIAPLSRPEDFGGSADDAFDVYVFSLPGFGFSEPLTRSGIDVAACADLIVGAMCDHLGHPRFAVHGGDWGGLITAQLAHAHAGRLVGAHSSIALIPGVNRRELGPDAWASDEAWMQARNAEAEPLIRSHVTVHVADPQTLAYGLADSPVATAAWLWERRRNWSDCGGEVERVFDREHLCTLATLYWATGAITSSLRLYHEHFSKPWPLCHDRRPVLEAPMGFAVFPRDVVHLPRSVIARYANLHRYTVMPRGGHFGAAEQPDLVVEDLFSFFAPLR